MKNCRRNQLGINAFLSVVKQLASVVFPLITFPYITKVLGVEGYGKYHFTASIISYISLIAGLGISNYAIREGSRLKDDPDKLGVFINEILSLNCLALILSYIILAVIVIYYRNNPSYKILLLIQGISVFFNVIGCEWLNVIYEDYLFITIRYIVFQIIAIVLMFIFVKSPDDLYKYALISQIAPIFGNISNLVHFCKRWGIHYKFVLDQHIFSHLKYVLILFANSLSMLIYVNSDITILGIMRGDTEVGIYSAAVRIYTIVKQLLNAMMLVAVPRMARWTGQKPKNEVSKQLDDLLKIFLSIMIPAIVGLFCLSRPIILLLSDIEYEAADKALKVLAVTLFFSTGVSFYSNLVLLPNNMEKQILKATSISAAMNIILNIILIPRYGFIAAAYTTLLSEAFTVIFMVIASGDRYFPAAAPQFLASLISGLLVYICCILVSDLNQNYLLTIILSITLSIIIWGLFWLFIKTLYRFFIRKRI